jgi:nitroimidazol reductase NimA-like FMN-containing flavoprotein (pyridoxamine 5'-phosphate oxidase superfamily)
MSVVYYTMEGDEILISTMTERAKAKVARRNPQVSLCILDEQWPLTYLVVYGRVEIVDDEDLATEVGMRGRAIMSGVPTPESLRPVVRENVRKEGRVVARIRPVSTFETPPRQVTAAMQDESNPQVISHWLGNSLPWDSD